MTVYELMAFLAKQPAGRTVFVNVAEDDDREVFDVIGSEETGGGVVTLVPRDRIRQALSWKEEE